jgi:hypothetical protein
VTAVDVYCFMVLNVRHVRRDITSDVQMNGHWNDAVVLKGLKMAAMSAMIREKFLNCTFMCDMYLSKLLSNFIKREAATVMSHLCQ